MPDKLTDNEIVKALEYCISNEPCYKTKCPFRIKKICGDDIKVLKKYALDLINRLQADCENYKQVAENQQSVTLDRGFEIKRLKEKIESLQAENERLDRTLKEFTHFYDKRINTPFNQIKAEAYKEFAKLFKSKLDNAFVQRAGTDYVRFIKSMTDNTLNELVGEDK